LVELGFGLSVVCALGVRRSKSSLGGSQKYCILVTAFSTISVQCSACKRQIFCFWCPVIQPDLPYFDTRWCTTVTLCNTELISCENHPSYFI